MRPLALALWIAGSSLLSTGCATSTGAPEPQPTPAAQPPSSVFEPAKGVRCDRSSRVCRYKGGPSVGLTRLFFGDDAAGALAPRMSASSYPYDRIFRPTPGASCDTLVTTCYDEKGANPELTRSYFGSQAAKQLEQRLRQPSSSSTAIVRRGDYITCDQMSQICYDRMGAGYGLTRMYLGEAEANRLLARLQPWKRGEPAPPGGAAPEPAPAGP